MQEGTPNPTGPESVITSNNNAEAAYATFVSTETYGLKDGDAAFFSDEFFDEQRDELQFFRKLDDGNVLIASSMPLTFIMKSQQEAMGRIYFCFKKPEALLELVKKLREKKLFFQIKVSRDIPRVDQVCLYFLSGNSKVENVIGALQEFYRSNSEDINPIEIPFAATLLLDDETPAVGINFKQSCEESDSPNSLASQAILQAVQAAKGMKPDRDLMLKYLHDNARYDQNNPAFIEDSEEFKAVRQRSRPNL